MPETYGFAKNIENSLGQDWRGPYWGRPREYQTTTALQCPQSGNWTREKAAGGIPQDPYPKKKHKYKWLNTLSNFQAYKQFEQPTSLSYLIYENTTNVRSKLPQHHQWVAENFQQPDDYERNNYSVIKFLVDI